MPRARLLLLVLLLCAQPGRAPSLCRAASLLGCLRSALAEARQELPEENDALDKRGFAFPAPEESQEEREGNGEPEEEELGKRTFPGQGRSKAASRARGKGETSPNRAASERRAKVTLSLDVPTELMNILFHLAKAKNLRAKAAANAHLMAQIGRRK